MTDPVDRDLAEHLASLDAESAKTLWMESMEATIKEAVEETGNLVPGLTYSDFIEWAHRGLQGPEHTKGWQKEEKKGFINAERRTRDD